MTADQNKTLIYRFLAELDKRPTAINEFFAPGCRAYLPGSPEPTDLEGFRQFVALLYTAFPDLQHKVEDQMAEHDKVVSLVTAWGTHQGDFQGILPTGKHAIIKDILITRIKEGKIVELWAQFDALSLLQQLDADRSQGQGES